jgi:hypothetical protein
VRLLDIARSGARYKAEWQGNEGNGLPSLSVTMGEPVRDLSLIAPLIDPEDMRTVWNSFYVHLLFLTTCLVEDRVRILSWFAPVCIITPYKLLSLLGSQRSSCSANT